MRCKMRSGFIALLMMRPPQSMVWSLYSLSLYIERGLLDNYTTDQEFAPTTTQTKNFELYLFACSKSLSRRS